MFGFPPVSNEEMLKTISEYLKYITEERTDLPSIILSPVLLECNSDIPSITVAFPIKDGMLNTNGVAHGAVIAMIYDISMGVMARWHQLGIMSPTLTMNIEYLKAIPVNSTLVVETKAVASARHTVDFSCAAWLEGAPETIVGRATGQYFIKKAMED